MSSKQVTEADHYASGYLFIEFQSLGDITLNYNDGRKEITGVNPSAWLTISECQSHFASLRG